MTSNTLTDKEVKREGTDSLEILRNRTLGKWRNAAQDSMFAEMEIRTGIIIYLGAFACNSQWMNDSLFILTPDSEVERNKIYFLKDTLVMDSKERIAKFVRFY